MPVPRLELEDVEAVITKEVLEGGRISGLSQYIGRRVLVVVPADDQTPSPERRRSSVNSGAGAELG